MHWQYNPYVLPLLIAAAVSVALAFYAWRRRPASGAAPVALLMLAVAVWQLGYALEMGSAEVPSKLFWARVQYLGIAMVPVTWLAFALQYTGWEKWLTRRNVALLTIMPVATLLLLWTNDLHGLFHGDIRLNTIGPFSVLDATYGVWFWVDVAYSYLLLLLGTLLLIQALTRSPHLYRRQVGVLLIGAFAPWVADLLSMSGLSPFYPLDLTPFAFTLTGLAVAWGLFRFQLFDIVPVARDAVIESMSDGVMVLDAQNRIVDLNPAAGRIVGCPATEAIGQPAAQVLYSRPDLVERYRDVTEAHEEIVLGEGEAQRCFDLRISPLYDRRGRLTGRLVVLRDITERKRAEELACAQRDLGLALGTTLGLDEALRLCLETVIRISGMDCGGIYLVDETSGALDLVLHKGLPPDFVSSASHYEADSPSAQLVMAGQPVYSEHLRLGVPVDEVRRREALRAIAILPVHHEDRVIACLNVASHILDEVPAFARTALEAIAAQIGSSVARMRAEEALRKRVEQLDVLYQVAEAGSRTLELQPLLEGLLDRILAVSGMQIGAIYQLDQTAQQLHLLVHRGLPAEFAEQVETYVPGKGLTGQALASGQTVVCEDVLAVPELRPRVRLARFRSQISLPLKVAGKIIGVLNLNSKEPRTWGPDEMRWLETVAGQMAIAIRNVRLYEESKERRLYLEGVLGAAPDAIVTLDAHHRIVEWNAGAEKLFEYSREEVIGQNLDDLITSPDVFEEAGGFTHRIMGGGEVPPAETIRYRKDGSPVDVIVAGSPIMVGDEFLGVVAVYTDITARVRMEETLRALALLDELTDLYNRRGLSILAEQQLKMAHRAKRRMVLLFADFDGLKQINDTLGHQEGDRALVETAEALEETFRESDIVARIGGDEFVVLAIETNGSPAEVLIHRLQENLEARNAREGRRYELSLSVGLARYDPERPCSIEELLAQADRAMYERKRG